jgi:hypothetical protein
MSSFSQNTNMTLEMSHDIMIGHIKCFPLYPFHEIRTAQQARFAQAEHIFWELVGNRINYLQRLQLGYIPIDPLVNINHDCTKNAVRIFSNFHFWQLQVIIFHFENVRSAACKRSRDSPFPDPRTLVAYICMEHAFSILAPCLSHNVNVGTPVKKTREAMSEALKFFRGTLSPNLMDKWRENLLNAPAWSDFTIGAICEEVGRKYLNKGDYWKEFKAAYKDMYNMNKNPELITMFWNNGYPVLASTRQPVNFVEVPLNLS